MSDRIEDRIAALTPERKALLERQLNKHAKRNPAPAVRRDPAEPGAQPAAAPVPPPSPASAAGEGGLDFSFLFFSGDGATDEPDKYRLLIECARYADANGFAAVWTPERHFKPFGGLYPNPAVIAAALAMLTQRVQLRAGSVVLPLQHPLRVVEEWSVVDNLSNGRVAIAFASGWLADDFVLAPERYASRRELMFREIQTVLKLWRGESVTLRNGKGEPTEVRIYPNPVQAQPPIWITATGKGTFIEAGKIGANVLTGLMEQGLEQCTDCIKAYRQARADNGHDARAGRVAVMLHTFLGEDLQQVKETVRGPFGEYLHSFLRMTNTQLAPDAAGSDAAATLQAQDQQTLLDFAFERYFNTRALLGTPQSCARMIQSLQAMDVDEVACLLDFGLDTATVLDGLAYLKQLKDSIRHRHAQRAGAGDER